MKETNRRGNQEMCVCVVMLAFLRSLALSLIEIEKVFTGGF